MLGTNRLASEDDPDSYVDPRSFSTILICTISIYLFILLLLLLLFAGVCVVSIV